MGAVTIITSPVGTIQCSWAWTLDVTVISACGMFVPFGINGVYTRCSVESSEYLSDLLKSRNIPHNVLNARPKVCKLLL